MTYTTPQKFLPAIKMLKQDEPLTSEDLLTSSFLIQRENKLSMYYAPHNEVINKIAKIVIVGITPGWHQMKVAFETFVESLSFGKTLEACLNDAKKAAGFAGAMRKNLINMLDKCHIHEALGIKQSADLFERNRNLLHTTSVIKYPVFYKDNNYTGHQPDVQNSRLLRHFAYNEFPNELSHIQQPALIIPLGKAVERIILQLQEERKLPDHYFLTGFPHPSGANGHRKKQFQNNYQYLTQKIQTWRNSLS